MVVLATAALLGGACTSTTGTATGPGTTPATTPTSTQDLRADTAIAKKAVLVADDLSGIGWTADKRSIDLTGNVKLEDACPDIADEAAAFDQLTHGGAQAQSDELKNAKTNVQIDDDVTVFATPDQAVTVANVVGDDSFTDCVRKLLVNAAKQSNGEIGTDGLTVTRTNVGPLGDDHSVYLATLPVNVGAASSSGGTSSSANSSSGATSGTDGSGNLVDRGNGTGLSDGTGTTEDTSDANGSSAAGNTGDTTDTSGSTDTTDTSGSTDTTDTSGSTDTTPGTVSGSGGSQVIQAHAVLAFIRVGRAYTVFDEVTLDDPNMDQVKVTMQTAVSKLQQALGG
jgi:hypothetical protein